KYFGVLYLGAMNTKDGVKVIEYNARFGDPEAQVLMSMLENDFLNMLEKLKRKERFEMKWIEGYMAGVVLATKDYTYIENYVLPLEVQESMKINSYCIDYYQTTFYCYNYSHG